VAAPLLTPASVRSLLAEHDVRPSRALGQNFLADPNTARRIARLAGVGPGDRVLEIGPGLGSLTLALLEHGTRIVALERDRRVAAVLETVVEGCGAEAAASPTAGAGARAREGDPSGEVRLAIGDALAVDFAALLPDGKWSCVSNLPYNVATPVVIRLLEEAPQVGRMLVMVQREVGERLAAAPGGKEYGSVSVVVGYHADAKIVGMVPPSVFVPAPKVESALVELTRRDVPPVDVPSTDRLFSLVRTGFGQRRKMLRQSLKGVLGPATVDVLTRAGVDPRARAEALDLATWAAVARAAEGVSAHE
jgi:16S rRNA (adenine1518-N6/adenine1519-N6)-dimethyltransferase